jgi:hypothetical protein
MKPVFRQVAFDPITLDALRIQDDNRWCPDSLKAFEVSGIFFDVGFERDKSLVDEVRRNLIRVGLGFQPSTCASNGRGRKVDQERFVVGLCLFERRVSIFEPIDEHSLLLLQSI